MSISLKKTKFTEPILLILYRLIDMHIRYPYQNSDAEEDRGINKEMKERMKTQRDFGISVSDIEKFLVGDIFKIEDKNVSMHPGPPTNCLLCW